MTSAIDERPDTRDGRKLGNWKSRYPCRAWVWIVLELSYLVFVLSAASGVLIYIGHLVSTADGDTVRLADGWEPAVILLKWIAVALAGFIGGTTYDLKWLYHSVARNTWNVDRVLWRIGVPPVSGTVAVFFSFLLDAGFVNLTGAKPIGWYAAIGLGFLFGYFSDNVVAYLYRWSNRFFGLTKQGTDGESSANSSS